jgi:phosphoribosylformimino-5-aminoimidazole carboxamide ribotide isomerase
MKVLFAMDLVGGRCVRLARGDFSRMTVYSDDPPSMIDRMRSEGARDFHVIDLDGARIGKGVHGELIRSIREKVAGYLEVGGGIRTEEDIALYTGCGVNGVIVGTRALSDPAFFEGLSAFKNIVLGLDMYDGKLMVKGWKEEAPLDVEKALEEASRAGVMALLVTNIAHDGMLSGPDYDGIRKMQSLTPLPLVASGGVAAVEDLKKLKEMGVWAAIVGKAFYEGKIGIEEAMNYAD